jgi:hypothetical protein
MTASGTLRRADQDREGRIIGLERARLQWAQTDAIVESPGGLSPPGAPRSVREPLDSYGSRCSAVSMAEPPVGKERWIYSA